MKSFIKINLITIILFITMIALSSITAQKKDEFRKIENNAFREGEKLTFDVKYGFVTAGVASFEIPKIKRISGREAYHVLFEVNTVSTFDNFFKVRDRYETYVDVEGIFPWRFEQHIREGSYSRDFSAFFDQRKGKAKTSGGEYDIPKYVNDIVSAFFYARTLDYTGLKVGDRIPLKNFYKDKVYDLDVVYHGKETIEVEAGKFDCIIVEPLVQEGGLFKNEGSIMIWLTNDEAKIPVRVKTKVVVGAINSDLTGYSGVYGKLTSKRK
ncbi:MAG: DUF3108 domain-containing protein [Ignavibacteriaceae bacterium]|nr:DUF3108 domain-containing protein [Ignavibacterium sp.]MCC6254053.1 DUF3108 domain-containing protein [Ignavibacteriaceae bacterium]HRN27070.1 DUF3108 domain-containing protein [Ignavibacteriaceae bacterium]HRP92542.1 DUF3108 domain-containing protein [Ignavibacteriaceae bacterium]HRQ54790.1 DUF3108 domain-containing protein [Ignavibacteriaceae bacterium]